VRNVAGDGCEVEDAGERAREGNNAFVKTCLRMNSGQ